MSFPRALPLLALWIAVAPVACRRTTPNDRATPTASASLGSASPSAPPVAAATLPAVAPLRTQVLAEAHQLEGVALALRQAVEASRWDDARAAYADLRQRARRLDPVTRGLARVASSQLGAYALIDVDEGDPDAGLPATARLLRATPIDRAKLLDNVKKLHRAARLLPGELEVQTWDAGRVGRALSEGVYVLGARLDGFDSADEAERRSDLAAEIAGVAAAVAALAPELAKRDATASAAMEREARALVTWSEGLREREPQGLLDVLATTGRLGAAVRRAFTAAGAPELRPAFRARRPEAPRGEAVTTLTFPALRGEAPSADEAALGKLLFTSKILSRDRSIACASCHDERHGFARPDPPTQTFDHRLPPRNAPGLWNAAYETFFFWDGRASTMATQIDVAVDRDMGGDWTEVTRRAGADAAISAQAARVAPGPLTPERIRSAIVAYERTLIEDDTRLDRHERGELTLTPTEQRGFDLFFGKARCSRCHRLPLLSGVEPPRFLHTELSAIGAPTRPDGRSLGPDTGRHEVTHQPADRGLFKAPGLRRVAETAPYFHHGGFPTLEQVVSFYDQGGGPGLGLDVPNADPDLRPLKLTADERSALLVFLRQSLGR